MEDCATCSELYAYDGSRYFAVVDVLALPARKDILAVLDLKNVRSVTAFSHEAWGGGGKVTLHTMVCLLFACLTALQRVFFDCKSEFEVSVQFDSQEALQAAVKSVWIALRAYEAAPRLRNKITQ
jgi:hypothetical protein